MEIRLPNAEQMSEIIAKSKDSVSQKGVPIIGRASVGVEVNKNTTILDVQKFAVIDTLGFLLYGDDATSEKIGVSVQLYTKEGTLKAIPSLSDESFLYLNLLNTDGDPFFSVLRYNPTLKRFSLEMKVTPLVCPFGFRINVKNSSATGVLNTRVAYMYRNMEG